MRLMSCLLKQLNDETDNTDEITKVTVVIAVFLFY